MGARDGSVHLVSESGLLRPIDFLFLERALGGGIGNLVSGCLLPFEIWLLEQGPVAGPTVLFLAWGYSDCLISGILA